MTRQTDAQMRRLLVRHARRILASSILKPVARERGYRSITIKAELKRLGFADSQCLVPGLLIPIWNVYGEIATYQWRPDAPRVKNGKATKYETPFRTTMVLDVHPFARPQLGDPTLPLWVTEGVRKGDAAVSRGLCCIALLGVWNFRGTNAFGGTTILPDWEAIALRGREVFIVYDSDVMLKVDVARALDRLGAWLASRGARVRYVYLPSGEGGTKVGLDDFLAAGQSVNDLVALATTELRLPPADSTEDIGPYIATANGIVYRRPTQNGPVDQFLSNFTAQIAEEVIADDGISERGELAISGELAGGAPLPRITVPLSRFGAMDWPVRQWGTHAIVSAGMGTKDRLREAIQRLSPAVPQRRVYEHPGWRELAGLGWCFLYMGGAIGASGPVADIDVALRGAAARIVLPDPPSDESLCAAVRASLGLLDLAPDAITAPLLAAVYRAILCEFVPADLSLFLVGPSGVYKSELAALVMQHVGAGFDRLHLPAQWSATANFLERIAFDFKDLPVAIDDFAPTGTTYDVARLHATADRVLRGIGNRGGRGRMNADGSLRPDYPPRGLVIGTGEDAPRGHSLRARMVLVEVGPGDVALDRLADAQAVGQNGVLVAGLAGFVHWLAPQVETLRARLLTQLMQFRHQAHGGFAHARTPDAVAHLAIGWWTFLEFAADVGAVTRPEAEGIFARVWVALGQTASQQGSQQAGEEPARRFIDLLGSALAGGYAHMASEHGSWPSLPLAWGWRQVTIGTGEYQRTDWQPQGVRAGWIADDALYLDLEAALTAVQRVGQATGSPIGVSPKTLTKRLHERGFLASTDQAQGELRIRRTLEGRRRRVLHLSATALTMEESGQSGQSGQADVERASTRASTSPTGRLVWPDDAEGAPESGQENRPAAGASGGNGRDGRIGRELNTPEAATSEFALHVANADLDVDTEVVEWSE